MIKLNKAQRDKLLGVAVGAVAAMAALWYLVVMAQQEHLAAIRKNTDRMKMTLSGADKLVRGGAEIGMMLTNRMDLLQKREEGLAPDHDPYSWMLDRIGKFILPRNGVNMTAMSQAEISDRGVIPGFPYKWATFHIKGVGYYHDFGKFFADFENEFPYFCIQNIEILPGGQGEVPEKLSYSFDIVAPLVPSGADTK